MKKKQKEEMKKDEKQVSLESVLKGISFPIELEIGGKVIYTNQTSGKKDEGSKPQHNFVNLKLEGERGNLIIHVPRDEFVKLVEQNLKGMLVEEKFKGMVDMASFISHEIRNPFFALRNVILSVEKLISDGEDNSEIREKIGVAKAIFDRIDSILTNIMVWLKGNRASEKILSTENIEAVLEDAISELYEMKRFLFKYDFSVKKEYLSDRIFVKGDRFLLKRAFLNILTNAVESMENSEIREIYVRTYDEGGFIVCEIQDRGCGISQENIKKIFLPFFTTKTRGMGLGMSAVKKIVEMHGGNIQITSEEGKGTKVKIIFPPAEEKS